MYLLDFIFFRSKNVKNLLVAFMAIGFVLVGFIVNTNVSANADSLQDYAGNYTFKAGSPVPSVEIKVVKDKLTASAPDGSEYELVKDKEKDDTFSIAELGATVTFTRNADKKVNGMKVSLEDGDIVADKDKEKETKKP
jgi:Domain of unknown function (DUF3471)